MILSRAEDLASELMRQYGLLEQGWGFRFDRAIRRLGYCNYRKHYISLAQHATLVNPEIQVRNTILHEIAHALCGHGEGHGPIWKAKCIEIGGNGQRLGEIQIKAPFKYQLYCLDCKHIWKYYRKPKLGPYDIHKCSELLKRIGYVSNTHWVSIPSNLKREVLS